MQSHQGPQIQPDGSVPHSSRSARPARRRYEPTAVYRLAERTKAQGVDLAMVEGPWRVGGRTLPRPGRNSLNIIPLVTNGETEVVVDTIEHAIDVAGLLNWCGLGELRPVRELTPERRLDA